MPSPRGPPLGARPADSDSDMSDGGNGGGSRPPIFCHEKGGWRTFHCYVAGQLTRHRPPTPRTMYEVLTTQCMEQDSPLYVHLYTGGHRQRMLQAHMELTGRQHEAQRTYDGEGLPTRAAAEGVEAAPAVPDLCEYAIQELAKVFDEPDLVIKV